MNGARRARWASAAAALLALAGIAGAGVTAYRAAAGGQEIYARAIQSGAAPLLPIEAELDPTMNPLRLTVTAALKQRSGLPAGREDYYVTLYQGFKPVRQWRVVFAAEDEDGKPRERATVTIQPIAVDAPGLYRLLLLRAEGDANPVFFGHEARLQRNAAPVDLELLWLGAALAVAGGLLQFFCGVPLRRRA